jgi:hypothetical protein
MQPNALDQKMLNAFIAKWKAEEEQRAAKARLEEAEAWLKKVIDQPVSNQFRRRI